MTQEKPFIERIEIKDAELLLDGEPYFKSLNTMGDTRVIRVVGVLEKPNGATEVHIGTGGCCFGYVINILQGSPEAIEFLTPVNYNIHDLMPIVFQKPADCKIPGEMTSNDVLTTGYGCHGAGVKLVSLHTPRIKEIVPGKEIYSYIKPSHIAVYPRFRTEKEKIYLDFIAGNFTSKRFVPSGTGHSIDLTDRLRTLELDTASDRAWKIDIGATIEAVSKYQIKRNR